MASSGGKLFESENNRGVQSAKIDEVLVRVGGRDNVTGLLCATTRVCSTIDRQKHCSNRYSLGIPHINPSLKFYCMTSIGL